MTALRALLGEVQKIQTEQWKNHARVQMPASKTRRTLMTNKQLNEVAETPTLSLQEMSQAEQAEVENLVDLLYTQRLVTNGSALLASHAQRTRRTTQILQERPSEQPEASEASEASEALATLLNVSVETSLRFFFAPLYFVPLFFIRERAGKTESGDGRGQERELASQREYSLIR